MFGKYFEQIVYFEGIEFIDYSFNLLHFLKIGLINSSIEIFMMEIHLKVIYHIIYRRIKEEENFFFGFMCSSIITK